MPTVLIGSPVLHHAPGEHVEILRAAGFTVRFPEPSGQQMNEAELATSLEGVDATLAGSEPYTPAIFARFPRLRAIVRTGVGYDAVHLEAAKKHRVPVGITPGTNHDAVAEQAWAMLLALAKNVLAFHQTVKNGTFQRAITRPIEGTTLGLVGLGRIGGAMAVRARAFRMRVIAFDPFLPAGTKVEGVERVEWDQLLAQSDVISLHAPHTPQTDRLIRAESIARMKDGVLIINTARGGLVHEPDLASALHSGKVGGAGLDVYKDEPPVGSPLLEAPNTVLAPHIAGVSTASLRNMAVMAAQTVVDLYQGRWPADRLVNANELGSDWKW